MKPLWYMAKKTCGFLGGVPPSHLFGGGRWPGVPTVAPSSFRGMQPLLLEITLQMSMLLTTSLHTEHV